MRTGIHLKPAWVTMTAALRRGLVPRITETATTATSARRGSSAETTTAIRDSCPGAPDTSSTQETTAVKEVRAHLDYVTQPCDILHMTVRSLFKNGLGPLKTKSPPTHPPSLTPSRNPTPDFVLRGPIPLLKVIKLSCVRHHMVSSRNVNEP